MDPSPLLLSRRAMRRRRRIPPLRRAARLLRQASGRRMRLREPSVQVRESAAAALERGWAHSTPVVVLDAVWNLAFVAAAVSVAVLARREQPSAPLRLWIAGYAAQCAVHVGCLAAEWRRRRREGESADVVAEEEEESGWNSSSGSDGDDYGNEVSQFDDDDDDDSSVLKQVESVNTMFSFIWWVVGFYWLSTAAENLAQDCPYLYWLCISFLAFDVVFIVICLGVASLVGIAVCCCLPCIIAILYAVTDQEGATKEEIDSLPKFKFRTRCDSENVNGEIHESFRGVMIECNTDSPIERQLSVEDAECCICLSSYDDGAELRELPCHHHFHCTCIDKWLLINTTCPLCKFDILKCNDEYRNEV